MALPAGIEASLCVVENDAEPRARAQVLAFAQGAPLPVHYALEPRVGLPQARNRLLAEARGLSADALVFVDDDEEVAPDWLQRMTDYARAQDWRAVIQGRVAVALPEAVPDHLRPHLERKARTTGEALRTCASNNTLVPLRPVAEHGLSFDESRTTEGGEDTIFFAACREAGIPMLYCREAVVTETIPPQRASLRWLSARKFRVGLLMGSGLVAGKRRSLAKSLFYLVKSAGQMALAALLLVCWQRGRATGAWLQAMRSLGYGLGFGRLRTHPYRAPEAR